MLTLKFYIKFKKQQNQGVLPKALKKKIIFMRTSRVVAVLGDRNILKKLYDSFGCNWTSSESEIGP